MATFTCGSCGARCAGSAGSQVLFHAASGDGGIACSPGCASALSAAGGIAPLLDPSAHLSRALDALQQALTGMTRAHQTADAVSASRAGSFMRAGLLGKLALGALGPADAGEDAMELQDHLHSCERPLQQAIFHLSALQALGHDVAGHLGALGGCDVSRTVSQDMSAERARTAAMLRRIEAARDAVWSLRR